MRRPITDPQARRSRNILLELNEETGPLRPHPVRQALADVEQRLRTEFGAAEVDALLALAARPRFAHRLLARVAADLPNFRRYLLEAVDREDERALAEAHAWIAWMRFRGARSRGLRDHESRGGAVVRTTESLDFYIRESELDAELPVWSLGKDPAVLFLEFGDHRRSPYPLRDPDGRRECALEGCYYETATIPPSEQLLHPDHIGGLGLNASLDTQVFELTFTGSPLGRDGLINDLTATISLFSQDPMEPIFSLLDRHLDFYRSERGRLHRFGSDLLDGPEDEEAEFRRMEHALKVILYLRAAADTQPAKVGHATSRSMPLSAMDPVYDLLVYGDDDLEAALLPPFHAPGHVSWAKGRFALAGDGQPHIVWTPPRMELDPPGAD